MILRNLKNLWNLLRKLDKALDKNFRKNNLFHKQEKKGFKQVHKVK
jgi:hypothetical protein